MDLLAEGLLVAAVGLALAYGWWWVAAAPGLLRTGLKTGAGLALALAAPGLGAAPAVVVGLALGALGDFFLSRAGQAAFLAGMAAFAAGHLAYGWAFLQPGLSVPMAAAALALALSTEVWLAPHARALHWPVRGYVLVISAMAYAALSLGVTAPLVTVGAALFLGSDMLLAIDRFVLAGDLRPRLGLKRLVWACYWAGQALILWGSTALA